MSRVFQSCQTSKCTGGVLSYLRASLCFPNQLINCGELHIKPGWLKKRPKIKTVVVRGVILSMVGRRQSSHLVAIDGMVEEKIFNFLCNFLIKCFGLLLHTDRWCNGSFIVIWTLPFCGFV